MDEFIKGFVNSIVLLTVMVLIFAAIAGSVYLITINPYIGVIIMVCIIAAINGILRYYDAL